MPEELGDVRPDGCAGQRDGDRCGRLVERGREVLAEGAIVGVDARALRPPVRLDVRGGIRLIPGRFELRIGQRRGRRSGELDQRDHQRQEPEMQFAQPHNQDCMSVRLISPARRDIARARWPALFDAWPSPRVSKTSAPRPARVYLPARILEQSRRGSGRWLPTRLALNCFACSGPGHSDSSRGSSDSG